MSKCILHQRFSTTWPAKLHSSSTTFQEGNKPRQPGETKWNSKQDKGNPAIRAGALFYFRHYSVRKITSRNRFHEKSKSHTIQLPAPTEQNHCGEEDKHYHRYLKLWLSSHTKQHDISFTKRKAGFALSQLRGDSVSPIQHPQQQEAHSFSPPAFRYQNYIH